MNSSSNFSLNQWLNQPLNMNISYNNDSVTFDVSPKSDFWQVTHYGFSRVDGNCFVTKINSNCDVCFQTKVTMNYLNEFDQAGVIVYYDEENWAKMSVENQLHSKNKLGSVVTKNKRSDWATQNLENTSLKEIFYRVSKRECNYLFEFSFDGVEYNQIRLFDIVIGDKDPLIGVYAASPLGEGFQAKFDNFQFSDNKWVLNLNDLPEEFK